jgi:hypothetical protein
LREREGKTGGKRYSRPRSCRQRFHRTPNRRELKDMPTRDERKASQNDRIRCVDWIQCLLDECEGRLIYMSAVPSSGVPVMQMYTVVGLQVHKGRSKRKAYGFCVVATLCLVSRLVLCRARGSKNDDKRRRKEKNKISTTARDA